ncbi:MULTISPECIES: hypothetical protein [unclassified Pseudomonas]|uniref:hypothetical protein n=1 Tax=unclassified Pseudomonas TaxID=196821 RepID=UPI00128CAD6C|nr:MULTISPECIES: hypothetical protein [unclassified Pseudomonas]MPQ68332.1 hypothetical protein [Pseudomonas sp. MWU12-2323]
MARKNQKGSAAQSRDSTPETSASDDQGALSSLIQSTSQAPTSVDEGGVILWPLRSYLDQGEVKRAGGKPYQAARYQAAQLIAKGLATDSEPRR